ncbi:MAG: hypothetical protein FJ278_18115, partial [Planctomycetes bacterium]|nr:hypothetical protein [Planctomycetota bacterium]
MAEKEERKDIPEKRQHKRFDLTSCWLTYARKGLFSYSKPIQDSQCSVLSMSRSGVRFLCVEEMKVGQKLMLDVTWKHGAPVQAKAEVIWTDDQVP